MMSGKPHLSVVIPVYRCAPCLPELCRRLHVALATIGREYEMVFVNGGSPDEAWAILQDLSRRDAQVKAINLSRNFGQHSAITAGLDHVAGDWTVVMDGDLQDLPEEIPNLYAEAQRGYDVVVAQRVVRLDGWVRGFVARGFYRALNYLAGTDGDPAVANFGIYARKVVEAIRSLREHTRFFPLFVNWSGFKTSRLTVVHGQRAVGHSSYSRMKMLRLACTVIVAYSNRPLRLSINVGLVMACLSILAAIVLCMKKILWGVPVSGWTTLIVSLYLLFGLLFVNLGLLGVYVGKIFEELKGRPIYLVQERINL